MVRSGGFRVREPGSGASRFALFILRRTIKTALSATNVQRGRFLARIEAGVTLHGPYKSEHDQ